eukprot:TRINITY_DN8590_c0_g1_i1.p1 TRINITY_DN8590_c0_g1~~TRINITY_DN8590_c0_g1_i1.p1  ORF type:complete len:238 (-),score=24.67 TRINITY_DN8590_c0_g1_i1:62-775(-)
MCIRDRSTWGMGAATSLLFASDFSAAISAIVVDSPFHSLRLLAKDFCTDRVRGLPGLVASVAIWYVRNRIRHRTGADINLLNPAERSATITIPGLFGVAREDSFTKPSYVSAVMAYYRGEKEFHDIFWPPLPPGAPQPTHPHDRERPQDWYQHVSTFLMRNISRGPPINSINLDLFPSTNWDRNGIPIPRAIPSVEKDRSPQREDLYASRAQSSPSLAMSYYGTPVRAFSSSIHSLK